MFLTDLLRYKLVDPSGAVLGRVRDLVASKGKFPRLLAISAKLNSHGMQALESDDSRGFVGWESVTEISNTITVAACTVWAEPPQGSIYLKADVLDRQIVDTEGARIVRVNDLLLSESTGGLTVVGADVGLAGILRSLGVERLATKVAGALGYEVPSSLIAWNYVATLSEDQSEVQLTVPARLLKELHPSELADILERLDPQLRQKTIEMMTLAGLAETLAETGPDVSREAVALLTEERARGVVELMPPDEAADLLGTLGYAKSEQLLGLMGVNQASILRELLGYPPESAGGRMTPSFVEVDGAVTVQEAIDKIRDEAAQAETVYFLYVVDGARRLLGVVTLRDLLRSPPDLRLSAIMDSDPVTVNIADDQEDVARTMARYDLLAVPVTDDDKVLKGIVTVDDIVDVIEQEASEDLGEVTGVFLGQAGSGRLAGFGVSIAAGAVAALLLQTQRPALASVTAAAWLLPVYLRVSQDLGTWSLARANMAQGLQAGARADLLAQELFAALAASGLAGLIVGVFASAWTDSLRTGAVLAVGIFVGGLTASIVGYQLPAVARTAHLSKVIRRGRVLSAIVGLANILLFAWALKSISSG